MTTAGGGVKKLILASFRCQQKKILVLLFASVEIFAVSRMRHFFV